MPRRRTDYIVVHCSATRAIQNIGVKEIRQWHKSRGFSDIGYHFVIRRDGTLEIGRKPLSSIGAHVLDHNHNTVGVCLVGGLADKAPWGPENNFTKAQFAALKLLIGDLLKTYPDATVLGHRDFSPDKNKDGKITKGEFIKDCPCFDARDWARANGLPAAKLPAR